MNSNCRRRPSSRDEDVGKIRSRTPGGDEVTLRLQQRRVDQTRAKVRIGLFGDEKRSQQIIRSIEGRLGPTAPADAAAPRADGRYARPMHPDETRGAPPQEPGMIPAPPPPLAPVAESSRIDAIDVVRGFALLGIFMVNVGMHGDAFGLYFDPRPPAGSSATDRFVHYVVKVFCEGKFYPLFSLLFGIGLAIQWQRARAAGRRLLGTGLRRLAVLSLFGLAHGLLLWYGDILFIYSIAGLLLLLLIDARPRTLAIVGACLMGVCGLAGTGLGTLGALETLSREREAAASAQTGAAEGSAADDAAPTDESPDGAESGPKTPIDRALTVFQDPSQMQGVGGPLSSPVWLEAEVEAYRDGPYTQALFFRVVTFVSMLVFCALGFWWNVAAMLLFGAALLKAGLFEERNAHWHRRFVVVGLSLGIPAGLLYAFLPVIAPPWVYMVAGNVLAMVGGPLLSIGYLGAITLIVRSGAARAATGAIAKVGRMALTNYLLQTVIATGIFYHWGLGLFGQTTKTERVGIVLAVYAAQIAFSVLWLRFFRFGPMEWLWRTLTYLRPQPMLRGNRHAGSPS